jgi:hypothetical protein
MKLKVLSLRYLVFISSRLVYAMAKSCVKLVRFLRTEKNISNLNILT